MVRWADPVGTMHTLATPNDPLFGQVWGLAGPGADANVLSAWNVTTGSHDVAVGVVDTGAAPDHPDLTANLRTSQGRNFVADAPYNAWADQQGHGTHFRHRMDRPGARFRSSRLTASSPTRCITSSVTSRCRRSSRVRTSCSDRGTRHT